MVFDKPPKAVQIVVAQRRRPEGRGRSPSDPSLSATVIVQVLVIRLPPRRWLTDFFQCFKNISGDVFVLGTLALGSGRMPISELYRSPPLSFLVPHQTGEDHETQNQW
jgi:hypothetical protein